MEKKNLVRTLTELGWRLLRNGSNHEIWSHPHGTRIIAVPYSKKLNGGLAKWLIVQAIRFVNSQEKKAA